MRHRTQIAEHHRAGNGSGETLGTSEHYARSIINSSLDMIVTVDNDRRIVEFNRAAKDAFGYTREEVLGKHVSVLYANADEGSSVHNHVFIEGKMRMEILNRRKNGEVFPSLLSASMLHDQDGKVIGVVGVSRDISDRKRTEENLRKSEETVRLLLESTAEAVCGLDLDGACTFVNPAFLRLTGFQRLEDVIGKPLHPLVHYARPDGSPYPPNECRLHRSLENGEHIHVDDEVFWRADGSSFFIECWSYPVFKQGRLSGAVVTFVDISERRQAERALVESEHQYRSLFENMLEGYAYCRIVFDHDRPVDFIYLDVNGAFETLTGLKDVVGKKVSDLIPGILESSPKLLEVYGRVALTGVPERFETWVESMAIWFAISVYSPRKGYFIAVFDNITERKKMEKATQRMNAELEKKNKELEQLVYATSHDLRSPLVNIQGFGSELENALTELESYVLHADDGLVERDRVLKFLSGGIFESLQFIRSSTIKMDDVLKGVLRLSRLGRSGLVMKRIDMSAMMTDIIRTFTYVIQGSDVVVTVDPLPPCVGDEVQINQLFSNLIDNGLKYLDPARPGRLHVSGTTNGMLSTYRVEDNGIGIPQEFCERIFDMFHRLDPGRGEGEGLGLTIARKIVDLHNGTIRVESEPGAGSSFYVSLPTELPDKENKGQ